MLLYYLNIGFKKEKNLKKRNFMICEIERIENECQKIKFRGYKFREKVKYIKWFRKKYGSYNETSDDSDDLENYNHFELRHLYERYVDLEKEIKEVKNGKI